MKRIYKLGVPIILEQKILNHVPNEKKEECTKVRWGGG